MLCFHWIRTTGNNLILPGLWTGPFESTVALLALTGGYEYGETARNGKNPKPLRQRRVIDVIYAYLSVIHFPKGKCEGGGGGGSRNLCLCLNSLVYDRKTLGKTQISLQSSSFSDGLHREVISSYLQ